MCPLTRSQQRIQEKAVIERPFSSSPLHSPKPSPHATASSSTKTPPGPASLRSRGIRSAPKRVSRDEDEISTGGDVKGILDGVDLKRGSERNVRSGSKDGDAGSPPEQKRPKTTTSGGEIQAIATDHSRSCVLGALEEGVGGSSRWEREVSRLLGRIQEHPERVLAGGGGGSSSSSYEEELRQALQVSFDTARENESTRQFLGPLSKLVTEGFTSHEIWLQLEMQTKPSLPWMRRRVEEFHRILRDHPSSFSFLPKALQKSRRAEVSNFASASRETESTASSTSKPARSGGKRASSNEEFQRDKASVDEESFEEENMSESDEDDTIHSVDSEMDSGSFSDEEEAELYRDLREMGITSDDELLFGDDPGSNSEGSNDDVDDASTFEDEDTIPEDFFDADEMKEFMDEGEELGEEGGDPDIQRLLLGVMDSDDDDDDDDDQDATAFGEEEDTGYDLFPNDRRSSRTFQTSRNSKLPSAKDAKYEDFFGDSKSDDKSHRYDVDSDDDDDEFGEIGALSYFREAQNELSRNKKKLAKDVSNESDDDNRDVNDADSQFLDEDEEGEEEEEFDIVDSYLEDDATAPSGTGNDEQKGPKRLSRFMEQQILLQQQIKAMEEKHYAEKDWQMTGEVRASQRPKESLLETFLEYESITKRPPQVTPEKNQSLEEKIRERIRSGAFDDVERKYEDKVRARVRRELDHERSQKSLSELYEDEFMREKLGVDRVSESLKKKHKEILNTFSELSRRFDDLVSFSFVSRNLASDEPEIKTMAPSISMEEAIPVVMSEKSTFAPEDIHRPARILKGESEISREDRKRHRRRMKRIAKKKKSADRKKEIRQGIPDVTKLRGVRRGESGSDAATVASSSGRFKTSTFFETMQKNQTEQSSSSQRYPSKRKTNSVSRNDTRVRM